MAVTEVDGSRVAMETVVLAVHRCGGDIAGVRLTVDAQPLQSVCGYVLEDQNKKKIYHTTATKKALHRCRSYLLKYSETYYYSQATKLKRDSADIWYSFNDNFQ